MAKRRRPRKRKTPQVPWFGDSNRRSNKPDPLALYIEARERQQRKREQEKRLSDEIRSDEEPQPAPISVRAADVRVNWWELPSALTQGASHKRRSFLYRNADLTYNSPYDIDLQHLLDVGSDAEDFSVHEWILIALQSSRLIHKNVGIFVQDGKKIIADREEAEAAGLIEVFE